MLNISREIESAKWRWERRIPRCGIIIIHINAAKLETRFITRHCFSILANSFGIRVISDYENSERVNRTFSSGRSTCAQQEDAAAETEITLWQAVAKPWHHADSSCLQLWQSSLPIPEVHQACQGKFENF